jgi:MFS transporter, putative metabolite:H+ symporter
VCANPDAAETWLQENDPEPSSVRHGCAGTGFGSAWPRAGSAARPILVGFVVGDFGIRYVSAFAAVELIGGIVTLLYAIETKGSARAAVAVGMSLHAIPAQ